MGLEFIFLLVCIVLFDGIRVHLFYLSVLFCLMGLEFIFLLVCIVLFDGVRVHLFICLYCFV